MILDRKCDFCDNKAIVDSRMINRSSWAYMCKDHFKMYGRFKPGLYTPIVDNFDDYFKDHCDNCPVDYDSCSCKVPNGVCSYEN